MTNAITLSIFSAFGPAMAVIIFLILAIAFQCIRVIIILFTVRIFRISGSVFLAGTFCRTAVLAACLAVTSSIRISRGFTVLAVCSCTAGFPHCAICRWIFPRWRYGWRWISPAD